MHVDTNERANPIIDLEAAEGEECISPKKNLLRTGRGFLCGLLHHFQLIVASPDKHCPRSTLLLEPMVVNREENEFICVTKWSLISQVRLIRSPVSGPETSPICRFCCYQRTKQSADTGWRWSVHQFGPSIKSSSYLAHDEQREEKINRKKREDDQPESP